MQPASLGRTVLFRDVNRFNSGLGDSPAVVTRVHGLYLVNLSVMHEQYTYLEPKSSIRLYETVELGMASGGSWFAYWPPKVAAVSPGLESNLGALQAPGT